MTQCRPANRHMMLTKNHTLVALWCKADPQTCNFVKVFQCRFPLRCYSGTSMRTCNLSEHRRVETNNRYIYARDASRMIQSLAALLLLISKCAKCETPPSGWKYHATVGGHSDARTEKQVFKKWLVFLFLLGAQVWVHLWLLTYVVLCIVFTE